MGPEALGQDVGGHAARAADEQPNRVRRDVEREHEVEVFEDSPAIAGRRDGMAPFRFRRILLKCGGPERLPAVDVSLPPDVARGSKLLFPVIRFRNYFEERGIGRVPDAGGLDRHGEECEFVGRMTIEPIDR